MRQAPFGPIALSSSLHVASSILPPPTRTFPQSTSPTYRSEIARLIAQGWLCQQVSRHLSQDPRLRSSLQPASPSPTVCRLPLTPSKAYSPSVSMSNHRLPPLYFPPRHPALTPGDPRTLAYTALIGPYALHPPLLSFSVAMEPSQLSISPLRSLVTFPLAFHINSYFPWVGPYPA